MELNSVYGLKKSVQTSLNRTSRRSPVAFASFSMANLHSRRQSGSGQPAPRLALGVARNPNRARDFHLAVRYEVADPLTDKLVEDLRNLTHGEIDVRETGPVVPHQWYREYNRPCRIGSSIMHERPNGAGTLGAFVRAGDDQALHVLSNNHVLADQNAASPGDVALQPGRLDGGGPDDRIASLSGSVPLSFGFGSSNVVDAAIARLDDGVQGEASMLEGIGRLAGVGDVVDRIQESDDILVQKIGRTTGHTVGRIVAFDIDISVEYEPGLAGFTDQIEIESTRDGPFSESGDSGSLIVDNGLEAIGLLFAGSPRGGSNGHGVTYANPLQTVLQSLNLSIVF